MKLLFTSLDTARQAEIGVLGGILDDAGIAYEIRNEPATYPGAPFAPELWVTDESDFQRAAELRDAWLHSPADAADAWTCPRCGEKQDGQFGACWRCAENQENVKTPPAPSVPGQEFSLRDNFFTILIIGLAIALFMAIAFHRPASSPPPPRHSPLRP